MTTAHRDRRRANDLTCMTALGDVAAVLDRHRVDREADEIAFGAVVTTMRTLIASLVDLDPAVRAELAALVGELGDDASAVAAWTRFEDFVEHWFVLVRHVVFGLRPDAVPGELDRLRVDLRRALRTPTPGPPPAPPRRATVLVIDDSSVVLAVIADALAAAGYRVHSAVSFADTEAVFATASPDVVLADVQLPDVEGDDLCARLKMRSGTLVPVILMSNLPEVELSRRAAAVRADAFVSKRHGAAHVVGVVDALLDELVL